jgi:hypothetical protein
MIGHFQFDSLTWACVRAVAPFLMIPLFMCIAGVIVIKNIKHSIV